MNSVITNIAFGVTAYTIALIFAGIGIRKHNYPGAWRDELTRAFWAVQAVIGGIALTCLCALIPRVPEMIRIGYGILLIIASMAYFAILIPGLWALLMEEDSLHHLRAAKEEDNR